MHPPTDGPRSPASLPTWRIFAGRSLLPLMVLLLLLTAIPLGPWFLLGASIAWWKMLGRIQ